MNRKAPIFFVFSIFLLDFFILSSIFFHYILATSDSFLLFILSIVSMNILIIVPALTGKQAVSFYSGIYLATYETAIIFLTGNVYIALLLIPSIAFCLLGLGELKISSKVTRSVSFIAVLLFMFLISKTLIFVVQPVPSPITVELLSDRMAAIGLVTPFTEYAGLFISTRFSDVIISPFQFFLYLGISGLLVENYHLIVPLLSRRGKGGMVSAGYGVLSALGCQCESAIGVFPAASLLILNILLLPFFAISIVLIGLTYFLVKRYYSFNAVPGLSIIRRKRGPMLGLAFFIISSQVVEVMGALFGLQSNPVFLFGTMMLMVLDGFFLYYILNKLINWLKLGKALSAFLFPVSLLMLLLWFIPAITIQAVTNPIIFSMMSYVSLISGFMISWINYSRSFSGITYLEGYVVALGIVPVVLFYESFYLEKNIWSFWTLPQQGEMSIVLWMAMIPFMWLVTQRSLISSVEPGLKSSAVKN
jgi:hypothetical protein